MKYLATLIFLACTTLACSSYQKTTNSTETNTNAMADSKEMISEGYTLGTIITSTAEGDCPYKIEVMGDEEPYYLDPINLGDDYKKQGMEVWFKFSGLRMMNRCDDAAPVNINAMQKK